MSGREDFDLVVVVGEVIAPALASVFRAAEVESVRVAWEQPSRLQDGSDSAPTELNVHLVCKGEEHTSNLWHVGMETYDRDALREHLVAEFSDFVAESHFGWGQQR